MPNIIVLVKQVFYTQDLRIDRTNKKLVTEGVARVISESQCSRWDQRRQRKRFVRP